MANEKHPWRKTRDGYGYVYRGFRIDNLAHRHSVGRHPFWCVQRHGIQKVSGLASRADAFAWVDDQFAVSA